jgi:hypothetical protein
MENVQGFPSSSFAGQAGFKVNWFGLRSILILEPLNAYKKAKNKVFQNLDWPLTYIFPRHMSIKTGYAMEGWNIGNFGILSLADYDLFS